MLLSLSKPPKAPHFPFKPGKIRAMVFAVFLVGTAQASELVPATVINVIDGDTIAVEADLWPGLVWDGSVRIRGVDTPEMNGGCDEEIAMAEQAKAFVEGMVSGKAVFLAQVEDGVYAERAIADVLVDGEDLGQALLDAGLALAYDGDALLGWCE